jgi:hypothetical protein
MHDTSGKQNRSMNKAKKTSSTHKNTVKHSCVLQVLCAALLFMRDFAAGGFGLRRWTTIEMVFKFNPH